MFRYDRPQAGRYRQFWQFDVEVIGDAGPAIDAEIVELALAFLARPASPTSSVLLNTIGDAACRPAYVEALRAYFGPRGRPARARAGAAADQPAPAPRFEGRAHGRPHRCRTGHERVPLRRVPAHFDGSSSTSTALGVEPVLTPSLVRGLDYYTRTAFELYRPGAEGQQQALGGGGRYDGLVELLGGQPTPGIGFGIGIDRVALALAERGLRGVPGTLEAHGRRRGRRTPRTPPSASRVATDLRAAGLACWPRPHEPQAQQAARGRRPGGRPLRGHLRRRAGARQRPGARPRRRHAATGPHRRPRPRPPSRAVPPSPRRGGMTPRACARDARPDGPMTSAPVDGAATVR